MEFQVPAHLSKPEIDSYPLISAIFKRNYGGFTDSDGRKIDGSPEIKQKLSWDRFRTPARVELSETYILQEMSDLTFEGLFSIFRPKTSDRVIQSKAELEALAAEKFNDFPSDDEEHGPFTSEQLQSYLVFNASCPGNIHWGRFVDFYNDLDIDQKEVVCHFFDRYHALYLDHLLGTTGPVLAVPEQVVEEFQRRTHDGYTFLFSDDMQKWLRDDRFNQQYRIDLIQDNESYLLAAAPTLKQAIAKAIVCAQTYKHLGSMTSLNEIDIYKSGVRVVSADVEPIIRKGEEVTDDTPLRLRWNLDKIGVNNPELNSTRKRLQTELTDCQDSDARGKIELNIALIDDQISKQPPVRWSQVEKTILAVEKSLGLQWRKVLRLEDDLGL